MNTIWEEKNCTEQETNCSNSNAQGLRAITKKTKSNSIKSEWKDIGGIRKWKRYCPTCKKEVWATKRDIRNCKSCATVIKNKHRKKHYTEEQLTRVCPSCNCKVLCSTIWNKNRAERLKRKCLKCHASESIQLINKGPKSKSHRKKISLAAIENYKNNPDRNKGKNNPMFGSNRCGIDNPNYDRRWSKKKREKMRIYWAAQFKMRGYQFNNYNALACKYFDELSAKMGWELQHAENGGEQVVLGYFLDSYDKNKNIVVEYDEPHHFSNDKLKKKDVDRMNRIIQHLKCEFYRYRESTKEFIKYA